MKKSMFVNLGFFVVIVAMIIGLKMFVGRKAETPAYLDTSRTLTEAVSADETSGKPVLAVVTADWCGPCQAFKRGALSDADVAAWITANTEPVYVDVTSDTTGAELLGVKSIPTVVMLSSGEEIARTGSSSGTAFIKWGNEALGAISSTD